MKIWFFEEYPTITNLKKLDLIDFPCGLVIADYALDGYEVIKNSIKNKHVKSFMYWPLLNKKEGYWFSGFAKRKAMLRVMDSLLKGNEKIMIDLELPLLTKSLFVTQFFRSFKNKKLLRLFLEKKWRKLYTAEYFYELPFAKFGGVELRGQHKRIKMMYSSMMGPTKIAKGQRIKFLKKALGDRLCLGLGVLGYGALGNEKQLTVEQLENDLELCKRFEVNEVFIYRLGGLTKEHVKVIKKFS